MKLIIVSGRSGSGKSTALNVLEDTGYYCIDNLPVGMLLALTKQPVINNEKMFENVAVSIDARNSESGISSFAVFYQECRQQNIDVEIIYLDALCDVLIKRFHATRRKHPLSNTSLSLKEAIQKESVLLEPIASEADLTIDTSQLTLYELRDVIKDRVAGRASQEMALLIQSFGFKHGVPSDTDYVFDVRCLPNPFWNPDIRHLNGLDKPIQEFLTQHPETRKMEQDIIQFMDAWLPQFKKTNRSYMTVSIGCTGGQHRSVYLCERIGQHFKAQYENLQIRHKELPDPLKK